jgi:hypothetical protein
MEINLPVSTESVMGMNGEESLEMGVGIHPDLLLNMTKFYGDFNICQ